MQIKQLEEVFIDLFDVKDQLKQLVYTRSMEAFAAGDRARDSLQTGRQVEERCARMRERLIDSFGGLPPGDTPLQPQVTEIIPCDGFRIEKVIFQSRPHTYVTSTLYVPDGIDSPRGAVLFLCGHHDTAKHTFEYQTVCQYLVRSGLVVFAVDPVGQGERFSYYEPSLGKAVVDCGVLEHDHAGTQSWLLGDSIARYFVHDAMRAVDYLCTRAEVDPGNIGVTGNSGGGTQTSLMMVCDPRIAAAAPATFIMNRQTYLWSGQPQDAEQIWPGMSAAGFDHEDILLAMAPRPVLVLAAAYDFFPIEGTRRTVERTRRFWDMYGRTDDLELFEEPEIHKYSVNMAQKAAQFFAKHLLSGREAASGKLADRVGDGDIRPLEHSRMWCTRTGQVRGDFAGSRGVYEENLDRLSALETDRVRLPELERKERALLWLRSRVFASRRPCGLNPRFVSLGHMDDIDVQSAVWWSQEHVMNHGLIFRHFAFRDDRVPLAIAVWESGTRRLQPHLSWIRETCAKGGAVLALDVTGVGAVSPNAVNARDVNDTLGTLYKFATDLFWLDDSLAAVRIFDVLRSLDLAAMLPGVDPKGLSLYADGRYSLYAQFAALLDARVGRVETSGGTESAAALVRSRYYDKYDIAALILPGMLKYLDVSDAQRWLPSLSSSS